MEITALNNQTVKDTVKLHQKKYRNESGKFLIEGYKSIEEAVNFGVEIEKVFVLKEKRDKYSFLDDKLIETNSAVMRKISTTDTYPEAVAIAFQKEKSLELLKESKKVILLENISDAGNLGTIIRSAAGFNIDTVILYGDTVDLYNPKCVRSAVGNLWKVNILSIKDIKILNKYFSVYERVATLPKIGSSTMLKDWVPKERVLVMFGSEADGLSDELKQFANKNLTIEMSENVESLNLSVSASVVMYKLMLV